MRGRMLVGTGLLMFVSSIACGMMGDGSVALDKQDAFTAQMCACADAGCVQSVQEAHAQWMLEHKMDYAAAASEDGERLSKSVEKMAQCVESTMAAQAGEAASAEPAGDAASSGASSSDAATSGKTGKRGKSKGKRGKGKGKKKR